MTIAAEQPQGKGVVVPFPTGKPPEVPRDAELEHPAEGEGVSPSERRRGRGRSGAAKQCRSGIFHA
jgi:hypothetical protein